MTSSGEGRPAGGGGVSVARRIAYDVVHRAGFGGAYADRALLGALRRTRDLDPRDRALSTRLAFGTVQRFLTLDHLLERFSSRPLDRVDAPVRSALRLGAYQLVFADSVPDRAAVSETVELVKRHSPRAAGFANALMRAAADGGAMAAGFAGLDDATPEGCALAHSHPEWIVRLWWDYLGPDDTRAQCRIDNEPAEHALRCVGARDEIAGALLDRGVPVRVDPELPEALVVDGPFDVADSPEGRAGRLVAQGRASQMAVHLLDPGPGMRVADLCAAPGMKGTHAAQRGASVTSVELHPARAQAMRRTAALLGLDDRVEVLDGDAATITAPQLPEGGFDRVLVDPPCSNLGTLRSRPDARWRRSPDTPAQLVELQRAVLARGRRLLAPGGRLVYATCTLHPDENEGVIAGGRRLLGHVDGTDGFYLAVES